MTPLREAWAALSAGLEILDPVPLTEAAWTTIERLRRSFDDRDAHTRLPLPIARVRAAAVDAILDEACRFDDVETETVDEPWFRAKFVENGPDPMARLARSFNADVDRLMRVLVPAARYRKGHYAFGRFRVPEPHGLHTDHSAEDPTSGAEPICLARIGTLGTHFVAGDYATFDEPTRRKIDALRYWTTVPEGEPDELLQDLLTRGTLATMPVDHVMLMVAGNGGRGGQVTQHMAARPPEGGVHSALFQRQYRIS